MIIHFTNNPGNLHPDEVSGIQGLRAGYDCLWIDGEGIKRFNPHLCLDETAENFKRHPLRLIWIPLLEIDFSSTVFSDQWRRNTMVLATDVDVRSNEVITRELECRGIALLMAGNEANSVASVVQSLTSLKLKSVLVEGTDLSNKLFKKFSDQQGLIGS